MNGNYCLQDDMSRQFQSPTVACAELQHHSHLINSVNIFYLIEQRPGGWGYGRPGINRTLASTHVFRTGLMQKRPPIWKKKTAHLSFISDSPSRVHLPPETQWLQSAVSRSSPTDRPSSENFIYSPVNKYRFTSFFSKTIPKT